MHVFRALYTPYVSPSMRREWIEIKPKKVEKLKVGVSLHAEGVD